MFQGKLVKSYDFGIGNPSGLAHDGKYLWVADNADDLIRQIDPRTGAVVSSFSFTDPLGLEFDGKYLYTSDFQHQKVYVYTTLGERIKVHDFSSINSTRMSLVYVDDKYIVVTWFNASPFGIGVFDKDSGALIRYQEGASLASYDRGGAAVGDYVFISSTNSDRIYLMKKDAFFNDAYAIKSWTDMPQNPNGTAFDGKYLWVASSTTDLIYQYY